MMTTAQLRVRVNTSLKVTTPLIRRDVFWPKEEPDVMMRKGEYGDYVFHGQR
jgi:hypothetical protein